MVCLTYLCISSIKNVILVRMFTVGRVWCRCQLDYDHLNHCRTASKLEAHIRSQQLETVPGEQQGIFSALKKLLNKFL